MKKIVVWYNPNKDIYYYRIVRGIFYERYDYVPGAVNNYGHVIVVVILFYSLELTKTESERYKRFKRNKYASFFKI